MEMEEENKEDMSLAVKEERKWKRRKRLVE